MKFNKLLLTLSSFALVSCGVGGATDEANPSEDLASISATDEANRSEDLASIPATAQKIEYSKAVEVVADAVKSLDTMDAIRLSVEDADFQLVQETSYSAPDAQGSLVTEDHSMTITVGDANAVVGVKGLTTATSLAELEGLAELRFALDVAADEELTSINVAGGYYLKDNKQYIDASNAAVASILDVEPGKWVMDLTGADEGMEFPLLQEGMLDEVVGSVVGVITSEGEADPYVSLLPNLIEAYQLGETSYRVQIGLDKAKLMDVLVAAFEEWTSEEITSEMVAELEAELEKSQFDYINLAIGIDNNLLSFIDVDAKFGFYDIVKSETGEGMTSMTATTYAVDVDATLNIAYGSDVALTFPTDLDTYQTFVPTVETIE
ncbi:MAG: hypothetical protein SOV58_05645 [Candidatus Enteromonas sp.]|nr:hypothetical protein [Candidatus Enteromonas sp.]